MDLKLSTFLIVCPLVFLASFVDSIGGGGGLISLPAYLFAGIPVHNAVATNKLSSATGTLISTIRLCKNKYMDLPLAIPGIVAALIGSVIGANLVLLVDDKILKGLLIVLLPVIAFYVLRKKDTEKEDQKKISRKMEFVIATVVSFLIGMYDGFYGPGTGTFLILAYTGLVKMDVLTAAGNTKLVNLTSNISALVVFLVNGVVILPLGLAASVFSIAGHYIGAGMVMKSGSKIVRPIILVVVLLLFVKVVAEGIA
ncbi:MAG: TSUP family transporter [Hespellia sp.]|nr:TSUP family transporter [Hespellia sp.]